jgi:purine-binding chemotaxis protein CheW
MRRAIDATGGSETDALAVGDHAGRQHQLILRVGAHLCAVPLAQVVETMRLLPIRPAAGVPPYVRGLCVIRGEPVPVVDAALLIGNQTTQSTRLVTIRTGKRIVALAADAVLGIYAVGAGRLGQLPPLMRDAAAETIAGIGMLDAELLLVLRAARILPQALFDRLAAEGAQL